MRWFGPEDHAGPRCRNPIKVPTPVNERCLICTRPIQSDDVGERHTVKGVDVAVHSMCMVLREKRR